LVFKRAIVRPPGANFAEGLTSGNLGIPVYEKALAQHARYCDALRQCGLGLIRLEADLRFPDSTFVEDTAILTENLAILACPGAPSRTGEVASVAEVLARHYPSLLAVIPPGTLDGGDVCQARDHFFIGISERTNEEGARQLAALLAQAGYTSAWVDIRETPGILHLKSGLTCLGERRLIVIDALAPHQAFRGYDIVCVEPGEEYAANCVRVNDRVLLAAGYPTLEATLRRLGYVVIVLDMSEFQKMDGGLSCLSLRF
jgi:dimethylargininase